MKKIDYSKNKVINLDNVVEIGENIAVYALKRLMAYRNNKKLDDLYYNLIRDIHYKKNYKRPLSDGYDLAQIAICFLCEHLGKRLYDMVEGARKKQVTIIHACTTRISNYLYKKLFLPEKYECKISRNNVIVNVEPFSENNAEKDAEKVEKIVSAMDLTERQTKVLDYYLQGKGICEISRLLSLSLSTVWRTRLSLQQKYLDLNL